MTFDSCALARALEQWAVRIHADPRFDPRAPWFASDHQHHDPRIDVDRRSEFLGACGHYVSIHEDIAVHVQDRFHTPSACTLHLALTGRRVGPWRGTIPAGHVYASHVVWTFAHERGMVLRSWSHASRARRLSDSVPGPRGFASCESRPERCYWARHWRLSARLAQTAVLIMQGYERPRIAEQLGITVETAKSYIKDLFRRAGVHGRIELAHAASRIGRDTLDASDPARR